MRYPELFRRLTALAPLPRAQWLEAEARGKEQRFARRDFFVRPGEPANQFAVALEGLFRAYRVSAKGEESVKSFRAEGEFICAYAEYLQGAASLTFIEALEPSRALVFTARDFAALEAGHACWTQLARRIAEDQFLLKERREQEFLDLSAEERLERFRAEHPRLEGRLAQREVAAYLGVTEVALSRIVSRRRKRGQL